MQSMYFVIDRQAPKRKLIESSLTLEEQEDAQEKYLKKYNDNLQQVFAKHIIKI